MFLKRWKQNKLLERHVEIGNEIYELNLKVIKWDLNYNKLCRRKRGNSKYALMLREAKLLALKRISNLENERRVISLELKTFST